MRPWQKFKEMNGKRDLSTSKFSFVWETLQTHFIKDLPISLNQSTVHILFPSLPGALGGSRPAARFTARGDPALSSVRLKDF
jgi:hypothetical protein